MPGLLLTPRPLSHPDLQCSIIFRLSSISSASRHERQVGIGSEATAGTAFRRFRVIPLTPLRVGHILPKQPFIAKMCSACQGAQLPHTFTALKAVISFCLCYSGTSLQAVREQYEPGRTKLTWSFRMCCNNLSNIQVSRCETYTAVLSKRGQQHNRRTLFVKTENLHCFYFILNSTLVHPFLMFCYFVLCAFELTPPLNRNDFYFLRE